MSTLENAHPPLVSPFPPIADYGFLSDCHTTALVAPSGAVEWMCLPRLDSESVFGALLELLDTLVPARNAVEALTWLTSAQGAGLALGAVVAGSLAA
jgi:GH15 family glucan-1,4-alpha-glucosidase